VSKPAVHLQLANLEFKLMTHCWEQPFCNGASVNLWLKCFDPSSCLNDVGKRRPLPERSKLLV
jgi:hypothetical protein